MKMRRLTSYFLAEFLRPLGFSYAALIILVLVAELFDHLDKFIAGKSSFRLVVEYLLALLPLRTMEVLPIAGLLATIFCLSNFSRHQEITAAMSGGIHPWRTVRPIIVCGIILSALSLAVGEWVAPQASRHATTLWKMRIRQLASFERSKFDDVSISGAGGVFYAIKTLDVNANRVEDISIDIMRSGRPALHIFAAEGLWAENRWHLKNGFERAYDARGLALGSVKPFDNRLVDLLEKPEDMRPQDAEAEEVSYKQLKRLIRRLKALGVSTKKHEVELHMKLAIPWANLIILLLGIPLAFGKKGTKAKAIAFALIIAFLYFGLMQVGRALGQKEGFSPILGAWLANIVFFILGGSLFLRMRKLS
jgi:lipopolysaccharide export system permease protein